MNKLTDDNYDSVILSKKKFVILASAEWCGPCRLLKPTINKLAVEYLGKVDFYQLDTDIYQDIASILIISALPTIIFNNTNNRLIGVASEKSIREKIEELIK